MAYAAMGLYSKKEIWGKEPQGDIRKLHVSSLSHSSILKCFFSFCLLINSIIFSISEHVEGAEARI